MYKKADSDVIKHDDLVEDGAIRDFIGVELENLVKYLPVVEQAIAKMAKTSSDNLKSISFEGTTVADIRKINEETKKANDLSLLHQKYIKLEAQANTALATQRKAEIAEKKAQADLDKKLNTESERAEKAKRKEASAYAQLNAELNKNRQIAKDLQALQVQGITLTEEQASALTQAKGETQRLDEAIKKIDYSVGQAHRNVGNYNNQLGTLGRSIKGFGQLGLILTRAIGIDPEVFMSLKEAGLAIRDIKHISEGAELAKTGEAAAHEANTIAIEAETVAYEEEKIAAAASTGGVAALVTVMLVAGAAILNYVLALKKEKEEEKAIGEIQKERQKDFIRDMQESVKISRKKTELLYDELIIQGKMTEAEKNRRLAAFDLNQALGDVGRTEKQRIENAAKIYGVDLERYKEYTELKAKTAKLGVLEIGKAIQDASFSKSEIQTFDKFQADIARTEKAAAIERQQREADYQNSVKEINEGVQKEKLKETQKANKDLEKEAEETLKAQQKAQEELRKFTLKSLQDNITDEEAENKRRATQTIKTSEGLSTAIELIEISTLKKRRDLLIEFGEDTSDINKQIADKETAIALKALKDWEKANADFKDGFLQWQKDLAAIDKKIAEERSKELKKIQDDITSGVEDGLKKRSELQQQAGQKEIDSQKRLLDVQTKLAAAGQDNVLAETQANIDKAEERKLQAQKRAQRQEENLALIKTFSEALEQGLESKEPFGEAFAKALGATGLVKTVFSKLIAGSAYEGTEDTGTLNGDGLDGKGGRLWMLHDEEGVLNKSQNKKKKAAGLTNEDLVNNAIAFEQIYTPNFQAANAVPAITKQEMHDAKMTMVLSQKFEELKQEIRDKPVQSIDVIGLREIIETVYRGGMTEKYHHTTRTRRNLPRGL